MNRKSFLARTLSLAGGLLTGALMFGGSERRVEAARVTAMDVDRGKPTDPFTRIWDTPEEDAAWAYLQEGVTPPQSPKSVDDLYRNGVFGPVGSLEAARGSVATYHELRNATTTAGAGTSLYMVFELDSEKKWKCVRHETIHHTPYEAGTPRPTTA